MGIESVARVIVYQALYLRNKRWFSRTYLFLELYSFTLNPTYNEQFNVVGECSL